MHNITRRAKGSKGGGIPNPFAGKYTDEKTGEEFTVQLENGQLISRIIPKFEPPVLSEDGKLVGRMHLDAKYYNPEKQARDYIKYLKTLGIEVDNVEIGDITRNETEPRSLQVLVQHNPVILGAIKIAYEIAAVFIPQWLNEKQAVIFSGILRNIEDPTAHSNMLNVDHGLQQDVREGLRGIQGIQSYHHAAALVTVKGTGLVCGVKIFDAIFPVVLSPREDLLDRMILIVNDAISKTWTSNLHRVVTANLASYEIAFDHEKLSDEQKRELDKLQGVDKGIFTQGEKLPVYNIAGEQVFGHMNEVVANVKLDQRYFKSAEKVFKVKKTFREPHFLRDQQGGALYRLKHVVFIYTIQENAKP
jgi:hypothetical protein